MKNRVDVLERRVGAEMVSNLGDDLRFGRLVFHFHVPMRPGAALVKSVPRRSLIRARGRRVAMLADAKGDLDLLIPDRLEEID